MKKVSQIVREIISQSPFLDEAIREDVANTSKIARKIKKKVEGKLMFPVSEASILVALRRMPQTKKISKDSLIKISDITVRAGLVEYIFANPHDLLKIHQQILQKATSVKGDISLNITRGNYETLIVVSNRLEKEVDQIIHGQKILRKMKELSSVTIRLPEAKVTATGIYYPFLKKLAWEGVSIVEIFSIASELTLIFDEKDIDRAFSAIKSLSQ